MGIMKKLILTSLLLTNYSYAAVGELTLHFIPSPVGMDWSSPSKLAKSAFMNRISLKPRFIGHVFVELKCGDQHELTGMSGKRFDYLNQLLIEQKGLGILYHSFEGALEEREKILPELKGYLETGHSNFVTFLLNQGQCQRALTYLSEYRENNVGRHYGLANRPRHGEGAGCTAFAVSFPDVLNILDQDMKESWSQTVNIPLELAGPPLNKEGVSFFKVMFNAGSWSQENQKHQKLTFWDPDKMHQWVKKKVAQTPQDFSVLTVEGTKGVVIDKSHHPSPQEPIWQQQLDPKNPKTTVTN
jgi:hypothetical protein